MMVTPPLRSRSPGAAPFMAPFASPLPPRVPIGAISTLASPPPKLAVVSPADTPNRSAIASWHSSATANMAGMSASSASTRSSARIVRARSVGNAPLVSEPTISASTARSGRAQALAARGADSGATSARIRPRSALHPPSPGAPSAVSITSSRQDPARVAARYSATLRPKSSRPSHRAASGWRMNAASDSIVPSPTSWERRAIKEPKRVEANLRASTRTARDWANSRARSMALRDSSSGVMTATSAVVRGSGIARIKSITAVATSAGPSAMRIASDPMRALGKLRASHDESSGNPSRSMDSRVCTQISTATPSSPSAAKSARCTGSGSASSTTMRSNPSAARRRARTASRKAASRSATPARVSSASRRVEKRAKVSIFAAISGIFAKSARAAISCSDSMAAAHSAAMRDMRAEIRAAIRARACAESAVVASSPARNSVARSVARSVPGSDRRSDRRSVPKTRPMRCASVGSSATTSSNASRHEAREPSAESTGSVGATKRLASMSGVTIVGAISGVPRWRARARRLRSMGPTMLPPGTRTMVRARSNCASPSLPPAPTTTSQIASESAREQSRLHTTRATGVGLGRSIDTGWLWAGLMIFSLSGTGSTTGRSIPSRQGHSGLHAATTEIS